jgi:predicted  nucleic acid-binding Zn-ribbon protein
LERRVVDKKYGLSFADFKKKFDAVCAEKDALKLNLDSLSNEINELRNEKEQLTKKIINLEKHNSEVWAKITN